MNTPQLTQTKSEQRTVFESACIIAGNGIGSGVMAIPYFISHAGIVYGVLAFVLSYIVSVLLHCMIAEIMMQSKNTSDILSSFDEYLFRGRLRNVLKYAFFIIMIVVLETNLAAYIAGASEILGGIVLIPAWLVKVVFYALAAIIVLMGLKTISVSEKVSVTTMGIILLIMIVFSIMNITPKCNIAVSGKLSTACAAFGMIMFSFSAIFAVPQIIENLNRNPKAVRKSIFLGLLINLLMSVVIAVCTIMTSIEVTKVAIVGWAQAVGGIVEIGGTEFILIAMFTSYWSIGFATTQMISKETKKTFGLSFALATIPALLLTLFIGSDFMEYMKIAGGAVAVIISVMVVPTYLICMKKKEHVIMNKYERKKLVILFVFIMYLVMAVGSFITV